MDGCVGSRQIGRARLACQPAQPIQTVWSVRRCFSAVSVVAGVL